MLNAITFFLILFLGLLLLLVLFLVLFLVIILIINIVDFKHPQKKVGIFEYLSLICLLVLITHLDGYWFLWKNGNFSLLIKEISILIFLVIILFLIYISINKLLKSRFIKLIFDSVWLFLFLIITYPILDFIYNKLTYQPFSLKLYLKSTLEYFIISFLLLGSYIWSNKFEKKEIDSTKE